MELAEPQSTGIQGLGPAVAGVLGSLVQIVTVIKCNVKFPRRYKM